MPFYPPKIQARIGNAERAETGEPFARGRSANLLCGSVVEFELFPDDVNDLRTIAFRTNGCGYMIAAADVITETLKGKNLSGLHGLSDDELSKNVSHELDTFPDERKQCLETCLDALHNAFADLRARRIEEFHGDDALICTCFGVTEGTIEKYIDENLPSDVVEITRDLRAGSGCGSCLMLIREMLEMPRDTA